jgi:hypothetical protein
MAKMEHFEVQLNRIVKKALDEKVANLSEKLYEDAQYMGEAVSEAMRNKIKQDATKYTGTLASAIRMIVSRNKNQVTLRLNEEELTANPETKYWYVLNYGETKRGKPFIPPENVGYWKGNEWIHTGKKGLVDGKTGKNGRLIKPNIKLTPHSFTPINYITTGKEELERQVGLFIKKVSK